MKNYKPEGYSVNEVAQILGCAPPTVRLKINKGILKANVDGKIQKGKRRRIRITREQLSSYLDAHKAYYSKELVNSFHAPEAKTLKVEEATEVHDISDLSGAWADIVKPETKPELKKTTLIVDEPKTEVTKSTSQTGLLLIDGRVAIGNVERETLKTIIAALLEDENFKPKTITVNL